MLPLVTVIPAEAHGFAEMIMQQSQKCNMAKIMMHIWLKFLFLPLNLRSNF